MIKKLIALSFLLLPLVVLAADVDLSWDEAANAEGYRMYMDDGSGNYTQVGEDIIGSANTTTIISDVPEDRLVLFKVSAYSGSTEAVREYSGAWYDHRNRLDNPSGTGIQ